MTSVPNRLLPLSGNKLSILCVFCATLLLWGCHTTKPVAPPVTPNGTTITPKKVVVDTLRFTDISKPPKKDDKPKNASTTGSGAVNAGRAPFGTVKKKDSYTIVVLLPFDANNFKGIKNAARMQEMSLEFYSGGLIALKDLQAQGMNIELYVHDTKSNSLGTILAKPELKEADMIVGPLQNDELIQVADFTKRNNIVHISPLNPNLLMRDAWENFIQASPSLDAHFEAAIRYFQNSYTDPQFVLVRGTNEAELTNIYKVQDAYRRITGNPSANIPETSNKEQINWQAKIKIGKGQPIIIIPSARKEYIEQELAQIKLDGGSPIILGLPTWDDYASWLGTYGFPVYMTRDYSVSKNSEMVADFRNRFSDAYGRMPTRNAYKGYDMMYYFTRNLNEYGVYLNDFLPQSTVNSYGMHTRFQIEAINRDPANAGKASDKTFLYENKYLNILRLEGTEFVKAN